MRSLMSKVNDSSCVPLEVIQSGAEIAFAAPREDNKHAESSPDNAGTIHCEEFATRECIVLDSANPGSSKIEGKYLRLFNPRNISNCCCLLPSETMLKNLR